MTDTPARTAAKAIVGALARQAITAGGAWLVTRGYVDQQAADSATGPIADYLLGAIFVGGSAYWSVARAKLMHSRWVQAWLAPARSLPETKP